jgi:hypothetical protein
MNTTASASNMAPKSSREKNAPVERGFMRDIVVGSPTIKTYPALIGVMLLRLTLF